jgi:hypothetical protein
MSAVRRPLRATVSASAAYVAPQVSFPTEVTYRGYRIEPASYCVSGSSWSPRVVVSAPTDEGWARRAPLYSPSTAKFPTRSEADRCALDVAKAWIDTAVEQRPE